MTAVRGASRRSPLRAVKDSDKPIPDAVPAPKSPMTLAQAIESGDYLQILLAQRREIAEALPTEKGPAKAALHRQLSIVSKEIQTLEIKAKAEQDAPHVNQDTDTNPAWDESAI